MNNFYQEFKENINREALIRGTSQEEVFFSHVKDLLIDANEINEAINCHFERPTSGSKLGIQIDQGEKDNYEALVTRATSYDRSNEAPSKQPSSAGRKSTRGKYFFLCKNQMKFKSIQLNQLLCATSLEDVTGSPNQ